MKTLTNSDFEKLLDQRITLGSDQDVNIRQYCEFQEMLLDFTLDMDKGLIIHDCWEDEDTEAVLSEGQKDTLIKLLKPIQEELIADRKYNESTYEYVGVTQSYI